MAKKETSTKSATKKKRSSKPDSHSKKRRFEFVEGNSSKFWEIELSGTSQTVRYGRIGTDGQTLSKNFSDAAEAQACCEKLIEQKIKKGYAESSGKWTISENKSAPKTAKKVRANKSATTKSTSCGWLEDSDRKELAIWLGQFDCVNDVEEYADAMFRRELNLPLDKQFKVYNQSCYYSPRQGDLHSLIGQMFLSASYYDAARASCRSPRAKLYNGGILVTDHFPEDTNVAKASQVDFLGFFKYDIEADELVSSIRPSYVKAEKLSVWCGTLPSKQKFYSYFNLPDFVVHADDFKFWNDFAEDFGIEHYDPETASYNLSRGMRPKPLADLITGFWVPPSLQKEITEAAHRRGLRNGNAVYMAMSLDYDELTARQRKTLCSRYDFHYVGTFDKPTTMSKKKTPRKKK